MDSIQEDMEELRGQLRKGSIQRAYRALLSYMMGLRTHFKNSYTGFAVSGLYQGYMDMTYFALVPPSLKHRSLKIAIVFDVFRFEAWLAGSKRANCSPGRPSARPHLDQAERAACEVGWACRRVGGQRWQA